MYKKATVLMMVIVTICNVLLSGCGSNKAFDTAKEAYQSLCDAADSTIDVMDSVYGAWYFGIYESDDSFTSTIASDLAASTSMATSDIEAAIKSLGESSGLGDRLIYLLFGDDAFHYCLSVVNEAYELNGTFDSINNNLDIANASLKTMTAKFDDYKHYPALKEFYSKVSSYAEFAQAPSGSFQQLKDTINDYENDIRTYRTDLSFVFE
jgi:uncharacterized protein YceK